MNNSAHSASPAVEPSPLESSQTRDRPHASSDDSFLTPSSVSDYDPAAIEARWQAAWLAQRAFAAPAPQDERTPAYVFAGCPFTSGDAHMGHIRSYTISDAYARFLRARGDAVLFSLGFDSFGLPAELEAVRRGVTPQAWVARCVERMRGQFERLGYSCDWERTFVSSEPDHYRWTQWLFLAMLERDLVYQHVAQVSWCDSCQTVLAALQVEDGTCWRCHGEVRFRRLPQWFMRISAYVEDNERGLDTLPGWSKAAIGAQRAVIGRVDGVELQATLLDGTPLTVFTPHADAIEQAAFIVVSPAHPQIDLWTAESKVANQLMGVREAGWRRDDRDLEQVPVVPTGALATVPGVSGTLPIVISPLVDARFGPTAALGIPALDSTDASIAQRLDSGSGPGAKGMGALGSSWKVASKSQAKPLPTVRYRARDFAISRQRAWGAPIPLVHCEVCGTVPVPFTDLPVRLPEDLQVTGAGNPLEAMEEFTRCMCPSCGGAAHRETDTIDCHVDGMWMWMPICVPFEDRPEHMFDHPEYKRWLPAVQIVWGADAGGYMFDQRLIGKVLQDLDTLPPVPGREPFTNALMHQMIRLEGRKMSKHLGNVVDPNELVVHVGADTVRLAVLQAASPGRIFNWNDQPIRYCQMFLKKLYSYAEPRLRAWAAAQEGANDVARTRQPRIELGDKRRRRLVNWCATALGKVTADFERLEMQRAAHNAMLLLTRIQDFEERAGERREKLREQDSEAVAAALLLLVQMLAPLTPHIAEELWSLAGNATLLAAAPWPEEVATEEASEQEGRPEGSATAQVPAQEEATM
ncbi:MAG TPA: class I tRNA ligase family protein [Solirubrobacteraceae bacterium]|jgi:leucyl-tRNA synthetase|nr:class I tRNA ligase family protein [Solirubrobacteraceae bacterium]